MLFDAIKREYKLVKVGNETRVGLKINDMWVENDITCESLNEMLANRYINERIVNGWIAAQR